MKKEKSNEFSEFDELMTHIDLSLHAPGTAVYSGRLAVHKDYMGRGLGKRMIIENTKYLFSKGYRHTFGISNSKISLNIGLSLGGEILKEGENRKEERSVPIYLVKR